MPGDRDQRLASPSEPGVFPGGSDRTPGADETGLSSFFCQDFKETSMCREPVGIDKELGADISSGP